MADEDTVIPRIVPEVSWYCPLSQTGIDAVPVVAGIRSWSCTSSWAAGPLRRTAEKQATRQLQCAYTMLMFRGQKADAPGIGRTIQMKKIDLT